jgi:UDP-glucose 4-epimerase
VQVTVTGGAGFIGANLCRRLEAEPRVDSVVVLDDLSTGRRDNLDGVDVTLIAASLLDRDAVAESVAGSDAIVHLGARPSVPRSLADPLRTHLVNATGTMHVLEAAREAGDVQVIVASSSSVYGSDPVLPKHESQAPRPMSPYAASKLATESAALAYQHAFGLPVLAFRFFNVFGPLQPPDHAYAAVIPAFVSAALRGEPLPVHGDGHQSRDFTFVDSVTAILADAVLGRVTSEGPVNLAFGTRTDLLGIAALLEEILGRDLPLDHLEARPGDVRDSQADTTALRILFPTAQPVTLRDGLIETIAWVRRSRAPSLR